MRFLFWLGNHSTLGQTSLEDVIGIVGHQMRALGHEVIWEPKNNRFLMPDFGINVVVEGFTPGEGGSIEAIKKGYNEGARFIYIATEEPTPKGFNHGSDPEMVKRQEWFPLAAKYCEGILHTVPGKSTNEWYGQFAPSAPIELGFAHTLIRSNDFSEPQYDFGFFGSLTKRRMKILKRLAKMSSGREKAVRIEARFPTQAERDKIVRESKVIVQIRKDDKMGLVSSSRCNTTLNLGRPVIAEPHELSYPWNQVITFADTLDDFYNRCLLAKSSWRGLHAKQMERFRTIMTPEYCIGNALRDINLDMNYRMGERRNVA